MPQETPPEVVILLGAFFEYLAAGDLVGLAADKRFSGMPAEQIRRAIDCYPSRGVPGRLTKPSEEVLRHPQCVVPLDPQLCGQRGWAVDVNLFFDGLRSDLALQSFVQWNDQGELELEVADVHVP